MQGAKRSTAVVMSLAAFGALLLIVLLVAFGPSLGSVFVGDMRATASAVRTGPDYGLTVQLNYTGLYEAGNVQIVSATLNDVTPVTPLPVELGEMAPNRPKSAVLRFAAPTEAPGSRARLMLRTRWHILGGPKEARQVIEIQLP